MKLIGAACLFTAALAGTAGAQQAAPPPNDKPFEEKWWPSEFGPDDKAGAISRITPEYILKAITLVKQGKTATLGKYYDRDIPAFGARIWNMVIPGTPSGGPFGSNGLVFHDEFVTPRSARSAPSSTAQATLACALRKATTSTTAASGRRLTSAAPAIGPSAWAILASSTLPRRPTSAARSSSTPRGTGG